MTLHSAGIRLALCAAESHLPAARPNAHALGKERP